MSTARHVVRSLLKAVHKNVTSVSGSGQWTQHLVEQARAPAEAAERLVLAQDITFLINNISHHKVRACGQMDR